MSELVMDCAKRIIQLFDDVGASQVEQLCVLDMVRALVPVSRASLHLQAQPSAEETSRS